MEMTERVDCTCWSPLIIIIIINPLTARVVGAPQMILQPVFSIFTVLHCPLGLAELQACPFPDVVFPPLPLSALSTSPFTVPCKMVLARPDERESRSYHFSLRLFTIVRRSSCGPVACWVLARRSGGLCVIQQAIGPPDACIKNCQKS